MPTKPMVKTLWLIIAAAFLIGLGLSGLGFALGGNAPVGFGPGGMRFVDFRTGTVYNSRMEQWNPHEDPTHGVITERVDRIRIQSIADIRITLVSEGDFSYEILMDGPNRYAVSLVHGEFEISPYAQDTLFGLTPNFGLGWGNWHNQRGEIVLTIPQELFFDSIGLYSIAGSINATGALQANNISLSSIAGSINVETLGNSTDWVNRLDIHSVSGQITVDKAYAHRLILQQTSGSADIAVADLSNFNFSIFSVSASVTANGQSLGDGTKNFGTGEHQAEINTISGRVTLTEVPLQVLETSDTDDSEVEEEYETP